LERQSIALSFLHLIADMQEWFRFSLFADIKNNVVFVDIRSDAKSSAAKIQHIFYSLSCLAVIVDGFAAVLARSDLSER